MTKKVDVCGIWKNICSETSTTFPNTSNVTITRPIWEPPRQETLVVEFINFVYVDLSINLVI